MSIENINNPEKIDNRIEEILKWHSPEAKEGLLQDWGEYPENERAEIYKKFMEEHKDKEPVA